MTASRDSRRHETKRGHYQLEDSEVPPHMLDCPHGYNLVLADTAEQ